MVCSHEDRLEHTAKNIQVVLNDIADNSDALAKAMIDGCCDDVTFKYGFEDFTMELKLTPKYEL